LPAAVAATTEEKVVLEHLGGLGGNMRVECGLKLDGTIGPEALDLIAKVLGLKGELGTAASPIDCILTAGNGICPVGTLVSVVPEKLSWKTELLLPGIPAGIWDHFTKDTGAAGEPAHEITCNGVKVLCEGLLRTKFIENMVAGPLFEFILAESGLPNCNDGGQLHLVSSLNGLVTVPGKVVSVD
jgi:hypothetical protein